MDKIYISFVSAHGRDWSVKGNERAVTEISLSREYEKKDENAVTREAAQQLQSYLNGERQNLSFAMELHGTAFQKEVWAALRNIPYGATVSYGEVASRIGRPKAVRAVGQAIGKNPCLVAVPCHRVMGKDGSLTGFSAGLELKRYLLALEQKR